MDKNEIVILIKFLKLLQNMFSQFQTEVYRKSGFISLTFNSHIFLYCVHKKRKFMYRQSTPSMTARKIKDMINYMN